jgi:alanine racemase
VALRALARVNLAAVERNAARLRAGLTRGARLCAVVKADGYGHGAVAVARAALAGGASSLAVATALEAAELRDAGVGAPVLIMGALSDEELPIALRAGAEVVAWNERFVGALVAARGLMCGADAEPVRVHVKLDTGMGRLGTRVFAEAVEVAERVAATGGALELAGAMTHFASADEDREFTGWQLSRFERFAGALRERAPGVVAHAANSAGTLRFPESHLDFVRCGIAVYGCDPMNLDPAAHGLEPALELTSYVAAVKAAAAGDSAGYGRQWIARSETWLATVPIGYGDGIRRALSNNCEVLIGGRRYPLVGRVSMDNITVEVVTPDAVRCGDRVTIIGADGSERITAEDLARRIDTINYEIVCGVSARVPRSYHRDGTSV